MKRKIFTRRRFIATSAAASATIIAAPFVRTAHAAGKLSVGFWDHWVPGANNTSDGADRGVGGEGEGRRPDRLHHHAGQQAAADGRMPRRRRNRATTSDAATWWPHDYAKQPRACRRHHGAADQAERRRERHGHLSRASGRPLARGAGDARQQYQGAVLAHRPDEAARRHRRAGDVSGRRAAQGGGLDARHVPQGRRGLPQGRASRSASASARPPIRSIRPAPSSTRFGAALVDANEKITVKTDAVRQALDYYKRLRPVLPAGCPGVGRRLQQQVAGLGQGRADHEPAERLGGRQARRAASRRAVVDARHAGSGPKGRFTPFLPTSGASGASARTSRRPRACSCICRSRRPSRRWWRPATASTCRPSPT